MRLIDADKLQTELLMSRQAHAQNERENQLMERDAVIVQEQPTVDAVEVVRCKNCEHYDKNVTIDETLSYCDMQECYEEPNDYCCYGIKKGGAK